jgi:hypothetical protein
MRSAVLAAAILGAAAVSAAAAAASPGPTASAPVRPIEAPADRAYPGEIRLVVDAADVIRRIIHVHETISGIGADTVLLYPKWIPGEHAPEGPIDRLAGLRITANGTPVAWMRDPVEVYALRVHAPRGAPVLTLDFDYLSPTSSAAGD